MMQNESLMQPWMWWYRK